MANGGIYESTAKTIFHTRKTCRSPFGGYCLQIQIECMALPALRRLDGETQ